MQCNAGKPQPAQFTSGCSRELGSAVKKKPEVLKTYRVLRSPVQKWQTPVLLDNNIQSELFPPSEEGCATPQYSFPHHSHNPSHCSYSGFSIKKSPVLRFVVFFFSLPVVFFFTSSSSGSTDLWHTPINKVQQAKAEMKSYDCQGTSDTYFGYIFSRGCMTPGCQAAVRLDPGRTSLLFAEELGMRLDNGWNL